MNFLLKPTRRLFVFTRNCTCVTRRQPFSSATTTTTTTAEKTEISTPDTSPTANDDDETKQQGQTRMEQLAAFRKFQEVANDMKWPAQNVREQLDKVEDIPDFVPLSFGEPEATKTNKATMTSTQKKKKQTNLITMRRSK